MSVNGNVGEYVTTDGLAAVMARMDARFERMDARFDQFDQRFTARFDQLDLKIDRLSDRVDKLDERVDKLDLRVESLEQSVVKLDQRTDAPVAETSRLANEIKVEFERLYDKIDMVMEVRTRQLIDLMGQAFASMRTELEELISQQIEEGFRRCWTPLKETVDRSSQEIIVLRTDVDGLKNAQPDIHRMQDDIVDIKFRLRQQTDRSNWASRREQLYDRRLNFVEETVFGRSSNN